MMAENPELFKEKVQESLRRHAAAINKHTEKGTYFFDYGNAFLGMFQSWSRCFGRKSDFGKRI
jgi:urocanate hydratase